MGDILDELSDIIEDGGAYSTRQPVQGGNHYSTGDSGLVLDDFDRRLLNGDDSPLDKIPVQRQQQPDRPPVSGVPGVLGVPRISLQRNAGQTRSRGGSRPLDLSQFTYQALKSTATQQAQPSSDLSYCGSSPPWVPPNAYGQSQQRVPVAPMGMPSQPTSTLHRSIQQEERPRWMNGTQKQPGAPVCQVFPYPFFNAVQSRCLPHAYEGNDNLVVSAPTGSGKTVVLELAICGLLKKRSQGSYKIIYLAPTKALCSEKKATWEKKFRNVGLVCTELTGDTNQAQLANVRKGDIIVTTPEKWDSMTRRWEDHSKLLDLVRLFLIDEVHILEDQRGAVLEVIVSRMKTIGSDVRFVALSATVPNSGDIASWLGLNTANQDQLAHEERFGPEFRPVKLEKHVYSYASSANDFVFDKVLNQKMPSIIQAHSSGKPTMVFCTTRNICVSTAKMIAEIWSKWTPRDRLWSAPSEEVSFVDKDLQVTGACGVAFHHAGLDLRDRQAIEDLFLRNQLTVICCTSTLAVGVNLPVHLVIIKNTVTWGDNGTKEYMDLEVMQMMGRAGRPQFDDSGVAVIMCRKGKEERYKNMEDANKTLESCLHMNLVEHLNAEIVLGTIANIGMAKHWLRSTFLSVRMAKNPYYYRMQDGLAAGTADQRLEDICERDLKVLTDKGLVEDNSGSFACTIYGKAMARYYIRFPTMCILMNVKRACKLADILEIVSEADEFRELRFRQGEKGLYKEMNKAHGMRFPLKTDPQLPSHKVYILIQYELGAIEYPTDPNFQKFKTNVFQDRHNIFKHCHRIISCLMDCLIHQKDGISTRNAMELCRSLQAKVWENSAHELRQLEGLGPVAVRRLINAGARCLTDLKEWPASKIETSLSRNPPFGTNILKALKMIPEFTLLLSQNGRGDPKGDGYHVNIKAEVGYLNEQAPARFRGIPLYANLLMERSDGLLVDYKKTPVFQMGNCKALHFTVCFSSHEQSLICHLACEQLVGVTKTATLKPSIPFGYRFPVTENPPSHPGAQFSADDDATNDMNIHVKNEQSEDDDYGSASYDAVFDQLDFKSIDEYTKPISSREEAPPPRTRTLTQETVRLKNGNWACRHKCGDKTKCKHLCCRDGLDRPPRPAKPVDDPPQPESIQHTSTQTLMGSISKGSRTTALKKDFNPRTSDQSGTKREAPLRKRIEKSKHVVTINLASPSPTKKPKEDLGLSSLRALHGRHGDEVEVETFTNKRIMSSILSDKKDVLPKRVIPKSPDILRRVEPQGPEAKLFPLDCSDSLDDSFDDDVFDMAVAAPITSPGVTSLPWLTGPTAGGDKAGTGEQVTEKRKEPSSSPSPRTPKKLKGSSVRKDEPSVSTRPQFLDDPVGVFQSWPTFSVPEVGPLAADVGLKDKPAPVSGLLRTATPLPAVVEESKPVGETNGEEEFDIMDFLGDCVQLEEREFERKE